METMFKRSLVILISCLIVWGFMSSSASAKDNESVSAAVESARKAGVPDETVSGVLALGYEHGLKAGEMMAFLDITRSAHENGFPLGPFLGKIEEGLAKGVEAHNIARVLNQELERFQFTYQLATQTMNNWKEQNMGLRHDDLARMAGTLSMGLTKADMETFFSGVPHAPMNQIANALEFMAGLVQAGMHQDEARDVVYAGMDSGFFSRPDWRLSTLVREAVQKDIPSDRIMTGALDVVKGNMDVVGAMQGLGLDPGVLQRWPYYDGFHGGPSGPSGGRGDDHGPSAPDEGSGSMGHGGSGGLGGPGSDEGSNGGGHGGMGGSGGSSGGPGM